MNTVFQLEQMGFTFSVLDGNLAYKHIGNDKPGEKARLLLADIRQRKGEAIDFICTRSLTAYQAIETAYKGELKYPVLLSPVGEWQNVIAESVWLCPSVAAKRRIREKDKIHIALTTNEFFLLTQCIFEQKQDAAGVVKALQMFGGDLLPDGAGQAFYGDPGADISPGDSHLWCWLLQVARSINNDFADRLSYLRGAGCRLVEDARTGYKLLPIIDGEGRAGWASQQAYDAEKWCLNPYKRQLVEILQRLKEENK